MCQYSSLNAPIETLTTDDAFVVSPVAGNINLIGGTNIHTTGILGSATVNLDDNVSIAGTFDAVGDITSSTGDLVSTLGNVASIVGNVSAGGNVTAGADVSAGDEVLAVNNITTSTGDIVSTLGAGSFATSVTAGNDLHVLAGGADIVGTVEFSDLVAGTMRTDAAGVISSLADGANGTLLIGSTAGTPIWAVLTAGANIGIVEAANSITISATGVVTSVAAGTNINLTGTATDPIVNLDDAITLTTVNATTFDTNVAAAAVTLAGTSLIADGTDANIDINITPNGTGVLATTELTLTADLEIQYGGTGVSTLTQYGVLIGNAATDIQALAVGATNTVLLGNTGANPSWGTVGNAALTNSSVTLSDGANITVTGSPLSLGGTATIALSGTTDHAVQLGNAAGSVTSLGVGATGETIMGATGVDPTWTSSPTFSGTVSATTFDTNVAAAAVTLTGNTLSADGTDANIDINITAKGTGDVVISSLSLGTVLEVPDGGTGVNFLTDHGLLVGSGAGDITALASASNGQIPIGSVGADPVLATITEGTNIDIINGAGSVTLETTKTELNDQTGVAYTLVLGDRGKTITLTNAAAIALTVPPNASVAFPVGTVISLYQGGAGTVTVTPGAAVTIRSLDSNLKISGQYGMVALTKLLSDTWCCAGSLSA